jgi:ABC-type transport system substrate-binding protein
MIFASVAPKGFAADWADPAKVLKVAFPTDVSGLDPAGTQETYASAVEARIFDALYVWDYLARPYRFVPSIASSMPEISADGRIWTIHIRRGIYFADDPAFEGKKRELTAADFVYAWKRVVDPRVRSPNSDLLEHKLVGLDAAVAKAKSSGRFDYDAEIQGMRAPDRYTLRVELVQPDYTFLELLDSPALRAVAREAIDKYADESGRAMHHPVGTGPYRLKEWQPARRIILEANPGDREERFPPAPTNVDAATKAVADSMKGKRRPQIGRIEISIIEETNPRLLMFNAGELDMLDASQVQTFPEAFKAAHAGQLQFSGFGWNGDIADDFMRLFYGPNAGAGNLSRFRNAEYDALYDKSRRTADTAERNRLYETMTKIISAQAPWCTNVYRISNTVVAPQIRGYRKNVHYFLTPWDYLDIDTAQQRTRRP